MGIKITNKINFWSGIVLLSMSLLVIPITGITTDNYGVTIGFFGLYFSLIELIAPSFENSKGGKK